MPASCAVVGCTNRHVKGQSIFFHRFPTARDLESSKIQNEWIARCKRPDNFNLSNCRICSAHFTDDDYERDLKNELLGLPVRRVLKKTAVPTLNLFNKVTNEPTVVSPCEERTLKKQQKEMIDDLMNESNDSDDMCNEEIIKLCFESDCLEENDENSRQTDSSNDESVCNENSPDLPSFPREPDSQQSDLVSSDMYEMKYRLLLQKYGELHSQFLSLQRNSKRKITSLNTQLNYYKIKCKMLRRGTMK